MLADFSPHPYIYIYFSEKINYYWLLIVVVAICHVYDKYTKRLSNFEDVLIIIISNCSTVYFIKASHFILIIPYLFVIC